MKTTTVTRYAMSWTLAATLAGTMNCSRGSASQQAAPPAAPGREATSAASPASGEAPPSAAPTAPSGASAATASGPRSALTGEHYVLNVELSTPSATPGESTLTVELRGSNGFHVNDHAPVGLDLEATNATTRAQWRAPDATARTQELASFRVPVQVTAAGATVRGTARGVVCRVGEEGVCEFVTRQFAVALP